jgi:flavin reductase (DIM6/NTAB) family NADH-FMN oxidoreductase RutF
VIGLARLLRSGRSLRHRPIALPVGEDPPVRVTLLAGKERVDVTSTITPLSLTPLHLGVHRDGPAALPLDAGARGRLEIHDTASGALLGSLRVRAGEVLASGRAHVLPLRPGAPAIHCIAAPERAWRYLLAWRQVRSSRGRPGHFEMSFADLLALNVFYVLPRPVYLVSVVHGQAGNIFPMDLVRPVGRDGFLLALRRSSPSVAMMVGSRRVAVSGVPAAEKAAAYDLGSRHREPSAGWDALPFGLEASALFSIPTPAFSLRTRELEIAGAMPVGSHMFFEARVVSDSPRGDAPQLAHVSDMYARWRERQGRPFVDA